MHDYLSSSLYYLKPLLQPLLGLECTSQWINVLEHTDLSLLTSTCLKLTLSKLLGLGIVMFSSLVKLPQLVKVWSNQSGVGLSISSILLELWAWVVFAFYNFKLHHPFTTYGETVFLAFQNFLLLLLLVQYQVVSFRSLVVHVTLMALILVYLPTSYLSYLPWIQIPLSCISKLPQLIQNWQQGHTGQLSMVTVTAYFAGSLARLFTSYQEVSDDPLVLLVMWVSAFVNASLFGQVLYYWNVTPTQAKKLKRKKAAQAKLQSPTNINNNNNNKNKSVQSQKKKV